MNIGDYIYQEMLDSFDTFLIPHIKQLKAKTLYTICFVLQNKSCEDVKKKKNTCLKPSHTW